MATPGGWEDEQQAVLRPAFVSAGILDEKGAQERLEFLHEAEATVQVTLRSGEAHEWLKVSSNLELEGRRRAQKKKLTSALFRSPAPSSPSPISVVLPSTSVCVCTRFPFLFALRLTRSLQTAASRPRLLFYLKGVKPSDCELARLRLPSPVSSHLSQPTDIPAEGVFADRAAETLVKAKLAGTRFAKAETVDSIISLFEEQTKRGFAATDDVSYINFWRRLRSSTCPGAATSAWARFVSRGELASAEQPLPVLILTSSSPTQNRDR